MARSEIDLGFPCWRRTVGNPPARSVWIDEALERESADPAESLTGVVVADVCIIGGGYTGLWTAYRLLELQPMLRLCVVESDLCGTGASGRNSGAAGHWWGKLPDLVRFYGPEDAVDVLRASENALVDIHAFVADEKVECELRLVPSVWSANTPVPRGPWEAVFQVAEKLGLEAPYRRLSAEELRHM
ncbi:MAG: FAD-dependent oxidoreductase, partial [Xanthobacteraceae bacterium]